MTLNYFRQYIAGYTVQIFDIIQSEAVLQKRIRMAIEVIKLVSCSTQLRMKFQLLVKTKMLKNKDVGISIFMSRIILMLSRAEHKKSFSTSGPEKAQLSLALASTSIKYS